jgi:nucleoside 2-deoxyribosyltransferase
MEENEMEAMKPIKIYLAGPLFTTAEMNQRKYEAKRLRELGFEVYSPIEQNADIGYHLDELYRRDIVAMTEADMSVLCLDNFDSGTMAELGWLVANNKPVFSHWTNWKYIEPTNLFVRGLALQEPNKLFTNLDSLFIQIEKYRNDKEAEHRG